MDGQASPKLSHPLSVIIVALGFLTVFVTAVPASEWKGTREVRDGVTYVWNPAEPMEGTVEYELREVWRLESERPDGSLLFGVVENAAQDDEGNVYVLDSQLHCVHRISPTGEYLGSIGREGDGPGEFRDPSRVFVTEDGRIGVIDLHVGNAVFLAPTGEPMGAWKFDMAASAYGGLSKVFPLRRGYAAHLVSRVFTNDEMQSTYSVYLFSVDGDPLKQIAAENQAIARSHMRDYIEESYHALSLKDAGPADRILVSQSYRDYRLHVYRDTGQLEMVIEREYVPLERTPQERAQEQAYWEGLYREERGVRVDVSAFHRTIANARLKDDGTIWVTSSRGWKNVREGVTERVDVFDNEGRFIREAVMKRRVSPERDLVLPLGNRYIIVEEGAAAQLTSVGAGGHAPDVGNERGPAMVCCQVVESSAGDE